MKKRILVVDDEPRMRRFVRMNLDLEGYEVLEADNGLAALQKVRDDMPDLVLLDVAMPEMDGFETLEHIREVSAVPVIMLTVKSDEDDRIRGLDLGADDYVTKPFSPRELLSRIRAVLRRVEPAKGSVRRAAGHRRGPADRLSPAHGHCPRRARQAAADGVSPAAAPGGERGLDRAAGDAACRRCGGRSTVTTTSCCGCTSRTCARRSSPTPRNPKYILTERGVGYQFVDYKKIG